MKTLLCVCLLGFIAVAISEQPKTNKQNGKKRSIGLTSDNILNSGHTYDWNSGNSFGSSGLINSGFSSNYGVHGAGFRNLGLTGSLGVSEISPATLYSSTNGLVGHHGSGLIASGGYGSGFESYATLPYSSVGSSLGTSIGSGSHLGAATLSGGYGYGSDLGIGNNHYYHNSGTLGFGHDASYGSDFGGIGTGTVKDTHQYRQITQHVPVSIPHPVPVQVTRTVNVPHPVKVDVPQPYPVPVKVQVPVDVPKPYAVRVPQPVPVVQPVKVPVDVPRPYPVYHTKQVKVEVEKPVFVKERVEVKVPVPKPYPVDIPTPVHVRVPHPVYVKEARFINTADSGLNAAHFGNNFRFDTGNYGLNTANLGLAGSNYGLHTTSAGIACDIPLTGGATFHSFGGNNGFGAGGFDSNLGHLHSLGGSTNFGTSGLIGDSSYFSGINSGSLGNTGSFFSDQSAFPSGFVGSGFNFAGAAADGAVHHEGDTVSVTSATVKASTASVDSDDSPSTPVSIISDSSKTTEASLSSDSNDSGSNNIEVVKVNDDSEK